MALRRRRTSHQGVKGEEYEKGKAEAGGEKEMGVAEVTMSGKGKVNSRMEEGRHDGEGKEEGTIGVGEEVSWLGRNILEVQADRARQVGEQSGGAGSEED